MTQLGAGSTPVIRTVKNEASRINRGIADDTDSSVFLELSELEYLEVDKGVLSDDLKEKLIAKGVEVKEYDY